MSREDLRLTLETNLVEDDEATRLLVDLPYLRSRYEAGTSIRQLAATAGCQYAVMRRLLVQAQAEFRPRGGARPGPRRSGGARRWDAEETSQLLKHVADGRPSWWIGQQLGRTTGAVTSRLHRIRATG